MKTALWTDLNTVNILKKIEEEKDKPAKFIITPNSQHIYRICFPAKNQAASPTDPINVAITFKVIMPQNASPASPIATSTKIAARRSPCASLPNLIPHSPHLFFYISSRDNVHLTSLTAYGSNSVNAMKKRLLHSPTHIQHASENKVGHDLKSVFSEFPIITESFLYLNNFGFLWEGAS